jgi:hypothetical protein
VTVGQASPRNVSNYATPAAAALNAEDAASDLFEEGVSSACFDERTEAQRAGCVADSSRK